MTIAIPHPDAEEIRTASSARRLDRSLGATLAVIAVIGVLGGCATTSLISSWRDPGYQGPAARKVLVVSMSRDPERRLKWEDTLVGVIRKQHAEAVTAYSIFPEGVPDTEQVKEKVREQGFDAVLVAHFIGADSVARYVQPAVSTVSVSSGSDWSNRNYGSNWGYTPTNGTDWGSYHTSYEQVTQPGSVESDRLVHIQVDMWVADGKGGHLVWVGRTETVNPSSPSEVSKAVSSQVVPQLKKAGLL